MTSGAPEKSEEPTPTKKHDISDLEFWKGLVVDNIGLAISAATVLIAGIRVASVSGGNLQLAGAIVQSMNVVNLIFVTLLPVVPYIIQIAVVQYLYNHRESNDNSNVPFGGKIILFAIFLISATFVPLVILVGYILVLLVVHLLNRFFLKGSIGFQVSIPAFAAYIIISVTIQASGPWQPLEQIQVKNEGTVYAYVLSSDVRWTTALTKNKSIRIYPTADLESRAICNGKIHWTLSPLSGWKIGTDLPSCK